MLGSDRLISLLSRLISKVDDGISDRSRVFYLFGWMSTDERRLQRPLMGIEKQPTRDFVSLTDSPSAFSEYKKN